MGRLHHLRETLPANLAFHEGVEDVEFVLVDYSSSDGLESWVRTGLLDHIRSGRVVYLQVRGAALFRPSHAKNIAHLGASGAVVCNLDADNYTGRHFSVFLTEIFTQRKNLFMRTRGVRGATGRLAFRKDDFCALGGYNESLDDGWGVEDDDLSARACHLGLTPITLTEPSPFLRIIRHDDAERVENLLIKDKKAGRDANRQIARKQGACNPRANATRTWGEATITKNFEHNVQLGHPMQALRQACHL
jgi:hypothetical protein